MALDQRAASGSRDSGEGQTVSSPPAVGSGESCKLPKLGPGWSPGCSEVSSLHCTGATQPLPELVGGQVRGPLPHWPFLKSACVLPLLPSHRAFTARWLEFISRPAWGRRLSGLGGCLCCIVFGFFSTKLSERLGRTSLKRLLFVLIVRVKPVTHGVLSVMLTVLHIVLCTSRIWTFVVFSCSILCLHAECAGVHDFMSSKLQHYLHTHTPV